MTRNAATCAAEMASPSMIAAMKMPKTGDDEKKSWAREAPSPCAAEMYRTMLSP